MKAFEKFKNQEISHKYTSMDLLWTYLEKNNCYHENKQNSNKYFDITVNIFKNYLFYILLANLL